MSEIELDPQEVLADRPFTNLHHSMLDMQVMRYLVTTVCLTLEHATDPPAGRPVTLYQPGPEQWMLRRVLLNPERMMAPGSLTVVGFFGQRSPSADLGHAQRLDRQMLDDLAAHDGLLCYVSIQLVTSNYANLVLFDSPEAKDRFGASPRHAAALRELLPGLYTSVRIYNGALPHGVRRPDALQLHLVKYYDYRSIPVWRARRPLTVEEPAWANR
jgi:hypothetical protein